MRVIVSTIGAPPYGISKYLVDIILPKLNKNQHKVKNSRSFVSQAQTWKIEPDEIQVSHDVTNLYPSIPIDTHSLAPFGSINNATEFLNVFNSQDP